VVERLLNNMFTISAISFKFMLITVKSNSCHIS